MSFAFPSTSAGGSGRDGGAGGKKSPKNKGESSGKAGVARKSKGCQLTLKVLEQSIQRIMHERVDLEDVLKLLRDALQDLDGEIDKVGRMEEVANRAHLFQLGVLFETGGDDEGGDTPKQIEDAQASTSSRETPIPDAVHPGEVDVDKIIDDFVRDALRGVDAIGMMGDEAGILEGLEESVSVKLELDEDMD